MIPVRPPHARRAALMTVLCTALLSACASGPAVDYDTAYTFTGLHNFWIEPPTGKTDPLVAQRLVSDIGANLDSKGFHQAADRSGADFVVTATTAASERPNNKRIGIGLGGGSYGGGGGVSMGTSVGLPLGSATVHYLTIQIEMADRASNRVIWRGSDEVKIPSGAEGEARAKVTRATVDTILQEFPPKR